MTRLTFQVVLSCCSPSSWQRHFSWCLPFSSVWSGAGISFINASVSINFWRSCLFWVLNSFSSPCNSRIWLCRWATTSWVAGRWYVFPNDRDNFSGIGKRDLLTSWKHIYTTMNTLQIYSLVDLIKVLLILWNRFQIDHQDCRFLQ